MITHKILQDLLTFNPVIEKVPLFSGMENAEVVETWATSVVTPNGAIGIAVAV